MLFAPEEPDSDTLRAPVLRVFDGDGFLTRLHFPGRNTELEFTVRFGFIDAPELGQPGGHEAREFLSDIIGGRVLDLVLLMKMDTGGIVDRHGRIVAVPYLRRDGQVADGGPASRNVEFEMVLNGWAWVLERYCPDERYLDALADAQRCKRGIWAWSDNIHPGHFKRQQHLAKQRAKAGPPRQSDLFSDNELGSLCGRAGCDGRLVRRTGQHGDFYGCSRFPRCRFSRSVTG